MEGIAVTFTCNHEDTKGHPSSVVLLLSQNSLWIVTFGLALAYEDLFFVWRHGTDVDPKKDRSRATSIAPPQAGDVPGRTGDVPAWGGPGVRQPSSPSAHGCAPTYPPPRTCYRFSFFFLFLLFFFLIYFSPAEVEVKTLKLDALKPSCLAPPVARPPPLTPVSAPRPGRRRYVCREGRFGRAQAAGGCLEWPCPGGYAWVTAEMEEWRRGGFSAISISSTGRNLRGGTAEVLFLREAIK